MDNQAPKKEHLMKSGIADIGTATLGCGCACQEPLVLVHMGALKVKAYATSFALKPTKIVC
jgi:hypothetical protein